jgi:hypothetical protein
MRAWKFVRDTPSKRKTFGGMPAYLTRWCNKAMRDGDTKDRPPRARQNGAYADGKRAAVAAALESRHRKEAT